MKTPSHADPAEPVGGTRHLSIGRPDPTVVTRRQVLAATVPLGSVLAGCRSGGDPTDSTPTTGTTRSPPSVTYTARVLAPATDERPLTVEVGVRNDGDSPVRVAPTGSAKPFQDLPRLTGNGLELALLPPDTSLVGSNRIATSRVNGCWRFVDVDEEPATKVAIGTAVGRTVDPGEHYAWRQHVYQDAPTGPCVPPGEYRASLDASVGNEAATIEADLQYVLAVPEDGAPTMGVEVDRQVRS